MREIRGEMDITGLNGAAVGLDAWFPAVTRKGHGETGGGMENWQSKFGDC